jgi:surfactin synthase thioesterase subunit
MSHQANATSWLRRAPSAASGRVFCIPQAGSGTSVFDRWPERRDAVEFLPVELPGRLSRFGEPGPGTLTGLAGAMVAGLEPYLRVPFAFFGHCWSAILAYEATAQLERAGRPPVRLFVSSEVPPQVGPFGRMLDMPEAGLAAEVEATIRTIGKTPHPELIAIYVKILRNDIELRRGYVPADPLRLACPITAFGWTDDREYRPEQMAGWADCGDTTFEVFAGQHNRFSDAPPELLDAICQEFALHHSHASS